MLRYLSDGLYWARIPCSSWERLCYEVRGDILVSFNPRYLVCFVKTEITEGYLLHN